MGSLYFGHQDGNGYSFDEELLRKQLSNKICIEHDVIPKFISGFNIPSHAEAEFKAECCVNTGFLKKMTCIDIGYPDGELSFTLRFPYQEQIRKHKKHRINKKWAKKYGYRIGFGEITVDEFECEDNTIDIIGRLNGPYYK